MHSFLSSFLAGRTTNSFVDNEGNEQSPRVVWKSLYKEDVKVKKTNNDKGGYMPSQTSQGRIVIRELQSTPRDFIRSFKVELRAYQKHHFIGVWQTGRERAVKELLSTMPAASVAVDMVRRDESLLCHNHLPYILSSHCTFLS